MGANWDGIMDPMAAVCWVSSCANVSSHDNTLLMQCQPPTALAYIASNGLLRAIEWEDWDDWKARAKVLDIQHNISICLQTLRVWGVQYIWSWPTQTKAKNWTMTVITWSDSQNIPNKSALSMFRNRIRVWGRICYILAEWHLLKGNKMCQMVICKKKVL